MTFHYDILSVGLFSMSGTLTAYRYRKLDMYGLAFVAMVTAVGGGTVRDILIDSRPIAWVQDGRYVLAVLAGFLIALSFRSKLVQIPKIFRTVDALAISFSSIAGLQKSLDFSASLPAAIIFGAITATTGGILRDVICREVPMVLQKEIYASACLAGGVFYAATPFLAGEWRSILAMTVVGAIRLVSVHFGWNIEISTMTSLKMRIRHRYKRFLSP